MMKKILFTFISVSILCVSLHAQTPTTVTPTPSTVVATPEVDRKEAEFDKKFRFGIRATPQPTWYKSNNNNSKGAGANFGFGFGIIMEFRLSKIIHFSTGVGGDFEGGYVSYRNDADFNVNVIITSEGEYVESKDGKFTPEQQFANGNTQYILKERKFKTTFVSIPLMLKMLTEEYSGARYFANTGLEIGIRAKTIANDTYVSGVKAVVSGTQVTTPPADELTKSNISIGKDASAVPLRLGMNLGLGMEYRLGGSTSLLFSANYFQSFTNLMRNDSRYLQKYTNPGIYDPLNQGYFMRAVRINIGLLF